MPDELLPHDWEQSESNLRGVSRCDRLKGYLAVILLNGKQHTFGPFKTSRLEAANAYDALSRYLLPYLKSKPVLNCPAETFLAMKDADIEEQYGREKLQALRSKLFIELRAAGMDPDVEASVRLDFITRNGSLNCAHLNNVLDKRRRRAFIRLEAQSMRNSRTFKLVESMRDISIPKAQYQPTIADQVVKTIAAYDAAQAELCTLIALSKTALDLNPNVSTK